MGFINQLITGGPYLEGVQWDCHCHHCHILVACFNSTKRAVKFLQIDESWKPWKPVPQLQDFLYPNFGFNVKSRLINHKKKLVDYLDGHPANSDFICSRKCEKLLIRACLLDACDCGRTAGNLFPGTWVQQLFGC